MITVRSGINDSTIWDLIGESVANDKAVNFRDVVMDNVIDTIAMNVFDDVYAEGLDIRDRIGEDLYLSDVCCTLDERLQEAIESAEIIGLAFGDRDWDESYRDMNVTFNVDIDKIVEEWLEEMGKEDCEMEL